jgi:hypothetical protein
VGRRERVVHVDAAVEVMLGRGHGTESVDACVCVAQLRQLRRWIGREVGVDDGPELGSETGRLWRDSVVMEAGGVGEAISWPTAR